MEVVVRELRDHLSRFLERVQSGEEIVVTEHGRAIARLVGLKSERRLDQLIAEGVIVPASERRRSLPRKRVVASGSVSELVEEQRR